MTKIEMDFFIERDNRFENKIDLVVTAISELKNEQKFCPAHGKPRLKNIIDKENDTADLNRGLKKFVYTGIIGLIFTTFNVILTLYLTGKIHF
jgi:hypothetical protein